MLQTIVGAVTGASTGDWLLLCAGALLLLYVWGTWNIDYFKRRGIASTTHKVPFVGDFIGSFTGFKPFPTNIEDLYVKGDGHGVFGIFEFLRPMFMIRDPEIVKIIAVKDFDNFINHRAFASEKSDPINGKNLFNMKDQRWRDMRATLSPAFTTSKIKVMLPLISQCAEQLSQHLLQNYSKSNEGIAKKLLPVDMKDIFTRLANDVIATTAFGVSCDSLKEPKNEFYTMGKTMTTFNGIRSLLLFASIAFPKLLEVFGLRTIDPEATNFFDTLVHETIRERLKKGIFRPDMLQLLMQAREGKLKTEDKDSAETEKVGAQNMKLDDEDISAQAIIFFFAGFETVSTALCLTSYTLSHHRDVQKRLQEEIAQVMEETKGKPTYESVQGMKYLDAVINEVLRLYPPAPGTDRVCRKDITIPAGETSPSFTIKKGTIAEIPIIGLHHDPQYWEEPQKFNPDRFSDENKHKIKPFTYMPFGVGPRICIGQRFALIEVKLALVHLLTHFDLHPCAKTKHPFEYAPGANLMAVGGFWCNLMPRDTRGTA